ncbi:hypothetical protein XENTR_v10004664 [Xenopus tropicalis]|nr:hypothetical protein XENTR_v10004664 [Xenopus tropicalis]
MGGRVTFPQCHRLRAVTPPKYSLRPQTATQMHKGLYIKGGTPPKNCVWYRNSHSKQLVSIYSSFSLGMCVIATVCNSLFIFSALLHPPCDIM